MDVIPGPSGVFSLKPLTEYNRLVNLTPQRVLVKTDNKENTDSTDFT